MNRPLQRPEIYRPMEPSARILITGGAGLVGVNLVAALRAAGFTQLLTPSSRECDLTNRAATLAYFAREKPTHVFHMAGFVRGIMGNMKNQGLSYLNNNLINTHVVEACHQTGVQKIVAMGTVAMYPDLPQDRLIVEDDVWQGPPHFSEYGYAQAKRGMLAMLQAYQDSYGTDYAFVFSTNLYGPHDKFDPEQGHVIPSLIKKFHDAKRSGGPVTIWGDGSAQRDFIYIKDAAAALLALLAKATGPVNMATGQVHSIRAAVEILGRHTGLMDKIVWDATKPNGQLYRAYDVTRLQATGFKPHYTLEQGLAETYDWYAANAAVARH